MACNAEEEFNSPDGEMVVPTTYLLQIAFSFDDTILHSRWCVDNLKIIKYLKKYNMFIKDDLNFLFRVSGTFWLACGLFGGRSTFIALPSLLLLIFDIHEETGICLNFPLFFF